jgi:hypothetical protein
VNDPKELEAARERAAGPRPEIDPWTRSELLEFIDDVKVLCRSKAGESKLRQLNRIVACTPPSYFGDRYIPTKP